jgi:hypothetical protein
MPQRKQPDHPQQLTLFVSTAKDVSFGVGVAWRERYVWKTKVSSLGNYTTTADAALFAIGMAAKNLISVLSRADHSFAEVVTELRIGLAAVESNGRWALPVIAGIRRQTQKIEDAQGGHQTNTFWCLTGLFDLQTTKRACGYPAVNQSVCCWFV